MREIKRIIHHCAATTAEMDIDINWIRKVHVDQNGWSDVGYHFFVKRDGTVEEGRPIERKGAHAAGNNYDSIGICYAGGIDSNGNPEDNRTVEQKEALLKLTAELCFRFPTINEILGHCDLPGVSKACPSYDAISEYNGLTTC